MLFIGPHVMEFFSITYLVHLKHHRLHRHQYRPLQQPPPPADDSAAILRIFSLTRSRFNSLLASCSISAVCNSMRFSRFEVQVVNGTRYTYMCIWYLVPGRCVCTYYSTLMYSTWYVFFFCRRCGIP